MSQIRERNLVGIIIYAITKSLMIYYQRSINDICFMDKYNFLYLSISSQVYTFADNYRLQLYR